TGICWPHHRMITENKAMMSYDKGVFYWEVDGEIIPLKHQPPILKGEAEYPQAIVEEPDQDNAEQRPVWTGCGRRMPKPKIDTPREEKKPRGTWAVSVPVEQRENGADTLDELLEAARDELDEVGISYGDGNRVKFHVLATALALFVQHAEQ